MNPRYLFGLPFVTITIHNVKVDVIVDTGFNGALLLPKDIVKKLGLKRIGHSQYSLADRTVSETEIFLIDMDWLGSRKTVSIVACESDLSLLGMELLENQKTTLCPAKNILKIEPI